MKEAVMKRMTMFLWGISLLISFSSLLAYTINNYEKKIKNYYQVRNVIDKIERTELERELRLFVSSGRPNRVIGTEGHEKAQAFLRERLEAIHAHDSHYAEQAFRLNNVEGKNLTLTFRGTTYPREVIEIFTHYDGPEGKNLKDVMPAADQNATGVIALLSFIKLVSELPLERTLRFVFLDGEEKGQAGATTYFNQYPESGENILASYYITTIGHDTKIADKEKRFGNFEVISQNDPALLLFIKHQKELYPVIDFKPEKETDLEWWPFYQSKRAALLLLTENRKSDLNPRLKTSNDFPETLNFITYANAVRAIFATVLAQNLGISK